MRSAARGGSRRRARGDGSGLRAIEEADDAPSLSTYIERDATREQCSSFLVHRSGYQLKEADPHSWAIARLSGAPKAALVEIQADEYGQRGARTASTRSCSRTRWTRRGSTRPTARSWTASGRDARDGET